MVFNDLSLLFIQYHSLDWTKNGLWWFECWTQIDKTWINLLFGWKETLSICHFYIDTWRIPRTYEPSGPMSCHSLVQTGKYQVSTDSHKCIGTEKWTWYSLNYVTNARTRTLLSLSWILLWNVSGWHWPLSRMTWTLPSITWLLKRKFEVLI